MQAIRADPKQHTCAKAILVIKQLTIVRGKCKHTSMRTLNNLGQSKQSASEDNDDGRTGSDGRV